MAFEVIILHSATVEVTKILEWHNEQKDYSAGDFYNAWLSAIEKLKVNPQFYFNVYSDYRRLLLEKFPYKIIYQISGDKVIIHRISHTSRDDREWFKQT